VSRTSPPRPRPEREARPRAPAPPPRSRRGAPATGIELQLAIAKTGIGLELAVPAQIGCIRVAEVAASLPDLRFPIDVSGGVARFRHRRGKLDRLVLELSRVSVESWAAPRLRGLLGVGAPTVTLLVRRGGATVGVVDAARSTVLAFELELDSEGDALALTLHDARGTGLSGPATALAIRAVDAVAGALGERAGARLSFPRVPREVTVALFPDAGGRAPDAAGLCWTTLRGQDDTWLLVAERDGRPAEASPLAVIARESARLAREADEAAFALDLDRSRAAVVAALERAPRHRELSRRLAEIDAACGGRAEAALATLRDAQRDLAAGDGLLLGALLAETGDRDGAIATFARVGETEPVGALAAAAYEAAAARTAEPYDALTWIDRAVARAPGMPGPRWSRLAMRLVVGRVEDARADAEHLEALASGARAKHAVWSRAGRLFRDAGLRAESASLFERALRYDPKDAEATAGLGAALVAAGKTARGAELLARALKMADDGGALNAPAQVDLARVLAEGLDDKPAAIARVREIPAHVPAALMARALEGRWRGQLGDIAGASLAFARARDLAEARAADPADTRPEDALAVLLEAATFESTVGGDWLAAQRHLGAALRLAPGDERAREAYRVAGRRVAGLANAGRGDAQDVPPGAQGTPWDSEDTASIRGAIGSEPFAAAPVDEAEDHARVEDLTRKLHADPTDDRVVDELTDRLLRLGRTHELFALLSARLDEAGPERRGALLPKQREVLRRLEQDAASAGRGDEAALYREALELL